jgi:rhodanese-related sulfurtransferase
MIENESKIYVSSICSCGCSGQLNWQFNDLINWLKSIMERKLNMAQTITKSAKDLVKAAISEVPAISVEDALALVGSSDHIFVDLRDGTEQVKSGIIEGAVTSSRGMMEFHIDPESPAHKPEFNQDKTYVFYCASGGRSALAAKVAMDMGLSPVVNLSGGVSAWQKAGGVLS